MRLRSLVQRRESVKLVNVALLFIISGTSTAANAEAAKRTYTLEEVVALALANHPAGRTVRAEQRAAEARVAEERTLELPKLGVSAELNRSTGNTAPGAFFPLEGFPNIAGAPRGKSFGSGYWQTGVSLWGSWDVLSLVRQSAAIDVALASRTESAAAAQAWRLDAAYRAADAFILELEAEASVRAARTVLERARSVATVTKSLVDQSLRPGADAARVDAELASAEILLARAEQSRDLKRAELAEAVGDTTLVIEPVPSSLLDPIALSTATRSPRSSRHPELRKSEAALTKAQRAERAVDLAYLPRLDVVAALWSRGSGLYGSPAQGLAPDIPNWGAGAIISWSFLDLPRIRARARIASAESAAAAAQRDEISLAIKGQLSSATSFVNGALAVARQTPKALTSARAAEQQAVARYKAGLSSLVDVADAERVLAQAEIDDAVARLEVRRGLLLMARASGDLGPFLRQARGEGK